MGEVALEIDPDARLERQIMRLAVALPERVKMPRILVFRCAPRIS
jgi:hypothetical protein